MGQDGPSDEGLDSTRLPATRSTGGEPRQSTTPTPESIGLYKILGKLGEGGMGVVYEAEQQNPKRRVAVKVVRGGQFVDEGRVRMFQREADTLARLRHPNIGGIYESGRTEDGQHFFAMELVRGETLDSYLNRRGEGPTLSSSEVRFRLAMFRTIADAVHYAHQRGVIHRDLKPSNIVVSSERGEDRSAGSVPEIKILDFGLARITEGDLTAATMTTEIGVIKGTLPYMSPEQARGNPEEIDVRTDVYALGVILYEMLAGRRPYDVHKKSLVEAVRVICEEPPRSLSDAVGGRRKIDPDLETIVGKALEKDVGRRYASAAALSEDVGRFLGSQPILARPPSAAYQIRKFARRNRALVGGIAATFVVLVAGVVVSTVLGLREASQRRAAEGSRNDLQAVVEFQAGMLSGVEPERMGRWMIEDLRERATAAARGRGSAADEVERALGAFDAAMRDVNTTDAALRIIDRNILDRAGKALEERFAGQPLIDAQLRQTIGATYESLGLYQQAEAQARRAVDTRTRELGAADPLTVESRRSLGWALYRQGRFADAQPLLDQVLDTALHGDDPIAIANARYSLARLYEDQNKSDEAKPLLLDCLEARARLLGDDDPNTLDTKHALAMLYSNSGDNDKAEKYCLESLEGRRRVLGPEHPETLNSLDMLGQIYTNQRRLDEAESVLADALETKRRVLGNSHMYTLDTIAALARVYAQTSRFAEAETLRKEALVTRRRVFGNEHTDTLRSIDDLAGQYRGSGRYDEAEPLYLEALETRRRIFGDDHRLTIRSINNLAILYWGQKRFDEAEPLFVEQVERSRRVWGDRDRSTLQAMSNLATLYSGLGRWNDAEPLYDEVVKTGVSVFGGDAPVTFTPRNNLAAVYMRDGRYDDAEKLLFAITEASRRVLGTNDASTWGYQVSLGELRTKQGRFEEAGGLLREALDARLRILSEGDPNIAYSYYALGCLSAAMGEREQALARLRKALSLNFAEADMLTEPTLHSLAGNAEFEAMLKTVKGRLGKS